MNLRRDLFSSNRFGVLWALGVAFALIAADPPTPPLAMPAREPKRPTIAAWMRGGKDATRPLVLLAQHLDVYSEINPFSYTIEANGALTPNDPVNDKVLIDFANANGIRVLPTVASGWDNSRNVARILADAKMRAFHIAEIIKVARQPGIDGIDLDYENLPPDAQRNYTAFVTALAAQLHAEGKVLEVTVPPKSSANDSCVSCKFADYAALGAVADRLRVMAYEFQGKDAPPGPIAPVWWMQQVIAYTVSVVPRERVILGIRLYGYDWGGQETPALWWSDVQALRGRYRADSGYVPMDSHGPVGESWLMYTLPPPRNLRCDRHDDDCVRNPGELHVVWYVDALYVQAAWKLVRDFQLGGMVLWRPGGEDPAIWDVLAPARGVPPP